MEDYDIDELIEQLEYDEDREATIAALVEIGESAVPDLIAALENVIWDVCDGAADALAQIGEPAVPALIDTFAHEFRHVALNASDAVARIGEPAVSALAEALNDTYDPVRSCLLYTSPSPRDRTRTRMPSSA